MYDTPPPSPHRNDRGAVDRVKKALGVYRGRADRLYGWVFPDGTSVAVQGARSGPGALSSRRRDIMHGEVMLFLDPNYSRDLERDGVTDFMSRTGAIRVGAGWVQIGHEITREQVAWIIKAYAREALRLVFWDGRAVFIPEDSWSRWMDLFERALHTTSAWRGALSEVVQEMRGELCDMSRRGLWERLAALRLSRLEEVVSGGELGRLLRAVYESDMEDENELDELVRHLSRHAVTVDELMRELRKLRGVRPADFLARLDAAVRLPDGIRRGMWAQTVADSDVRHALRSAGEDIMHELVSRRSARVSLDNETGHPGSSYTVTFSTPGSHGRTVFVALTLYWRSSGASVAATFGVGEDWMSTTMYPDKSLIESLPSPAASRVFSRLRGLPSRLAPSLARVLNHHL